MSNTLFTKGDMVQAKKEWLDKGETQENTIGIVLNYNPGNDLLQIGVLNPQDYAVAPVFNHRGECYEII